MNIGARDTVVAFLIGLLVEFSNTFSKFFSHLGFQQVLFTIRTTNKVEVPATSAVV